MYLVTQTINDVIISDIDRVIVSATDTLTVSGAELLAEPSCLGTAGINVEARTEIGRSVLVVVISEVGT